MNMNSRKLIFILLLGLVTIASGIAQTNPKHVRVRGYYRSNGTYVQPHYKTAPNSTNIDNFSTSGNINPYTGQPGWIKPDNNTLNSTYNGWYSNFSSNDVQVCSYSNCTEYKLVYSSGYMYKSSNYCISHTPKCLNPSCDNPQMINYYGSSYLKYCDEHEYTCKSTNCYNIARVDNSGFQSQQTSYCGEHTPICENPTCSNYSKVKFYGFYGTDYEKFCSKHTHTCKSSNCLNIARVDNSGFQSQQTSYCGEHTPICENPTCSNFSKVKFYGFYGTDYEKFCSKHTYTCKTTNCFNIARVDNSGFQRQQTSYCEEHTPICLYPNCSNFSMVNYYNNGYLKYCTIHKE